MLKSCVLAAVAAFGLTVAVPSSADARVGVFVGPNGGVAVTGGRSYYGGYGYGYAYPSYGYTYHYPAYTTYSYPSYGYAYPAYGYATPYYGARGVIVGPRGGGAVYGPRGAIRWR